MKTRKSMTRGICFVLLALLAMSVSGCRTVAFHERQRLVDPVMDLTQSKMEAHVYQKTFYSREGSVGGIGTGAGGGCGCY